MREEVHPGDVVWFPPGEKHWHGATPTTAILQPRRGPKLKFSGRGRSG